MSAAQPPPPPSSRRPRPMHAEVLPPRPAPKPGAGASALPRTLATDELSPEGSPRVPDSLVPVRFADLLDERPADGESAKGRSSRRKVPVLGAFVAGGVVVLALQTLLTRPGRLEAPRPAAVAPRPDTRVEEAARVREAASVREHDRESPSSPGARSNAPSPAEVSTTRVVESSAAPPAAPGDPASPGSSEPARVSAAPEPGPAAAAPSSRVDDAERKEEPPVRRKKRARAHSPGYEPPTAAFPE